MTNNSENSGPLFLLSSERSGTNLLRRRLTEYQNTLYGPSPIHFLKHLYFGAYLYGDLSVDSHLEHLVNDALSLCYEHFAPWDIKFTTEQIMIEFNSKPLLNRSVVTLMHILYTKLSHAKGFSSYFCKDNNLFEYAHLIADEIPNARFIYLYRDPRDTVLSQIKRPLKTSSVITQSQIWKREQEKCISVYNELKGKYLIHKLSYEELITDEDQQLAIICDKFGLKISDKGKIHFENENTDIHEWVNLKKPTMKNNSNKYLQELTTKQIDRIESITWHAMQFLGYLPENNQRPELKPHNIYLENKWSAVMDKLNNLFNKPPLTPGQKKQRKMISYLQNKLY